MSYPDAEGQSMSAPTDNTRCVICRALEPSGPHGLCNLCFEIASFEGRFCWVHGTYPMRAHTWDDDRGIRRTEFTPQPCPWCEREPAPEWERVAADAWAKSEQEAA